MYLYNMFTYIVTQQNIILCSRGVNNIKMVRTKWRNHGGAFAPPGIMYQV